MNSPIKLPYARPGRRMGLLMATCTLALSSMAAIAAPANHPPANHLIEKRIESDNAATEDFANTTLQQRIELRKKSKAHWRDPPTGDRTSSPKRSRDAAQQAPAEKGSSRDTR
ncbi:MAG: hypothetical protein HYZ46_00500 [Nitrosomonadales bacterium]|nr:hypothetical protein [Nitrosomonadales bacterium]